ncbi:MAG: cobalamin-dependent protein [Anaerolineales bacterium]|nr:cobalamin-dependent protein [Anaerolineales bacterium]
MDNQTLFAAVLNGDGKAVAAGVRAALAEGVPAADLLNGVLIPAMDEVGRLFELRDFYIPEMMAAAVAMAAGVAVLKPQLAAAAGAPTAGRAAIGTVKGDLHDMGKNLVTMMLEGAGFVVQDLGVDVPPQRFVQAAHDGAQLICLSALLTTTMRQMKLTIDALQAAGLRGQVKVLIGGAPISEDFAGLIGADGFAGDAGAAVRAAKRLMAG